MTWNVTHANLNPNYRKNRTNRSIKSNMVIRETVQGKRRTEEAGKPVKKPSYPPSPVGAGWNATQTEWWKKYGIPAPETESPKRKDIMRKINKSNHKE